MSRLINFICVVLIFSGGLVWLYTKTEGDSNKPATVALAEPGVVSRIKPEAPPQEVPPPEQWTAQLVEQFQMKAMDAVVRSLDQNEFEGAVTERPDYVSPAEWYILKQVADRHNKPEQELVRMVNYLRFTKLLERWQSNEPLPESTRHVLAETLLDAVPARVTKGDMNVNQAQKLQVSLINGLEQNPDMRRERLAEESARIGVLVDIN